MRYIAICAKDIPVVPEFFQELENRTRSKVIKQYIRNTLIPFYLDKNRPIVQNIENPNEEVLKSLEANDIKNIISDILQKKNKISEHKFIRDDSLLSYKMFPTNIFKGIRQSTVKKIIRELKKYLKEKNIKLNNIYIKKINKTLQKDKFLRHFVKENYTEQELLTAFIIYKFKILNVIDLNQDFIFTYSFLEDEKEFLRHVIDYLNLKLDVENIPNWKEVYKQKEKELKEHLSNLSFEELQQEIEKYNFTDETIGIKSLQDEIRDKDVKLVYTYPDKYSWVTIISKRGLEQEGSNMNHCVGGFDYWNRINKGETVIYSLRDKFNKPHITIEVTDNEIIQIQGYGNSDISEKYHDMLLDGLKKYIVFDKVDDYSLNKNGILQQDNMLYSVYDLPDNIECDFLKLKSTNRKLELKNVICRQLEIENCPNINISGNIIATNHTFIKDEEAFFSIQKFLDKIKSDSIFIHSYYVDVAKESEINDLYECIPIKIKKILEQYEIRYNLKIKSLSIKHVKGDLDLCYNEKIKELPEGLVVDGNLDARNSKNIVLPKNLYVKGYVDLTYSKNIVIQSGTRIKYDLFLGTSSKIKLPANLTVKSLMLNNQIKVLPENLKITGNLNLLDTNITNLSKNTYINGKLTLNNVITSLPENLHVGKIIFKESIKTLPNNLTINELVVPYWIDTLPDNLTVLGDLYLFDTAAYKVTKLPKNLKVGRNLYLNEKITEFPKDLVVKGNLVFMGKVDKLPEGLNVGGFNLGKAKIKELPSYIKGNLDLSNYMESSLPDDLTITGNLDISKSDIRILPSNLNLGGSLTARFTNTKLPENFHVKGDLILFGSHIKELPKGLKVDGNLNLSYTQITDLPKDLKVGGSLDVSHTQITELPKRFKSR